MFQLAVTLTLTPRPSKPRQFVCRLNHVIKESSMKFVHWFVRYQRVKGRSRDHNEYTHNHEICRGGVAYHVGHRDRHRLVSRRGATKIHGTATPNACGYNELYLSRWQKSDLVISRH